jgi:hypothetical protein
MGDCRYQRQPPEHFPQIGLGVLAERSRLIPLRSAPFIGALRTNHESLNQRSSVCIGRGRCLRPTSTDVWHPRPWLHRSNAGPFADLRNPEHRRRVHVSDAGAATDVCDSEHRWRVHPAATWPAANVPPAAINRGLIPVVRSDFGETHCRYRVDGACDGVRWQPRAKSLMEPRTAWCSNSSYPRRRVA